MPGVIFPNSVEEYRIKIKGLIRLWLIFEKIPDVSGKLTFLATSYPLSPISFLKEIGPSLNVAMAEHTLPLKKFSSGSLSLSFSEDFIDLFERDSVHMSPSTGEAEREADFLLTREPDMQLDPRTLRSLREPKADI